jgi:hypothetical protein
MLFTKHTLYAVPIYHEELYGNIKMDTNRNVALGCTLHKVSKILPKDTGTLKYQNLKPNLLTVLHFLHRKLLSQRGPHIWYHFYRDHVSIFVELII